jgi:hypothetical protein
MKEALLLNYGFQELKLNYFRPVPTFSLEYSQYSPSHTLGSLFISH